MLTGKAANVYKAFLRNRRISYIIAEEDSLDYALALEKLKMQFGITTLMLGGDGILNWSFIQAGMCDEISIVIAPVADGSSDTPALFETRGGLAQDKPVGFPLQHTKVRNGGSVWLRYVVNSAQ